MPERHDPSDSAPPKPRGDDGSSVFPRLSVPLSAPPGDRMRMTMRRTSQGKIIGHHPRMREVLDTIERAARTPCNVLVTGESGTGKELIVAALHDASPRAQGPLVIVNCGAIPNNMLESELFGVARNAFTGVNERAGYVGKAEGGTLFLDEVGELPLEMQVKILRLLQQREYSPVGASQARRCDIRVVAATNRDLAVEVNEKRFREDLLFRLDVVHVHLPPLRERGADTESLALYFLQHVTAKYGREGLTGFHPDAIKALRAWRWPGNVRELEHAIERAVATARGPLITLDDLPAKVRAHYEGLIGLLKPVTSEGPIVSEAFLQDTLMFTVDFPEGGIQIEEAVRELEKRLVRFALERTGHNRNRAAQLLGIKRTTLVEKLRRYGLLDP